MKERRILGVTLVILAFHKKNGRNTHMLSFHECNICDASFAHQHHKNGHNPSVHKGKKPLECNICDARFAQKTHLNGHIASVHDGKKPHKCSICDYKCATKGNLNIHVDTNHKGKKPQASLKRLKCNS